jgi:hypothetical protein
VFLPVVGASCPCPEQVIPPLNSGMQGIKQLFLNLSLELEEDMMPVRREKGEMKNKN